MGTPDIPRSMHAIDAPHLLLADHVNLVAVTYGYNMQASMLLHIPQTRHGQILGLLRTDACRSG